MNLENIIGDYNSFITDLISRVGLMGIDIKNYPIDHIGYRVETVQEYKSKKIELKALSVSFDEKIHNGRPISTFILKEPIKFKNYLIDFIELPSPKKEKSYPTGLEHIEIAVGNDFEKFVGSYKNIWNKIDNSSAHNKTSELTFDNGKTVKFHKLPLVEVINLEANQ